MRDRRSVCLAMAFVALALSVACSSESVSTAVKTVVETVAGTGVSGFADGPSGEAQFDRPEGLALAPDGTLYIVETLSGRVRKISPDGAVTTVLDTKRPDSVVKLPHRFAVGPEGGLYLTDAGNNRVVRINAEGDVVAVVGTGEQGDRDGPAEEAQFDFPIGIAVAKDGTVYVADSGNSKVRKISPEGNVTTLAGDGQRGFRDGDAADARFNGLNELTLDNAGNVYVTDSGNSRVRKISPEGVVSTVAGSGERGFADGDPVKASFKGPAGIAVDAAGNLYVAEIGNHRIRKIVPGQQVLTIAGDGEQGLKDGAGAQARFNAPIGLAIGEDGVIYVADSRNHVIRKIIP